MSVADVPRSRSAEKRFYGVMEAIVTAVDDEAREGRVKVRFPWFDDRTESQWCRVRQEYAGNGYGSFFVPEVGDEVLVAFVQGDMRLPVVLGGLYNGQDKPVTYRASDKDEKVIRTKGGHQITLADTPGGHKITIIDSAEKSSIVIDTTDNSITIKAEMGKLVLEGKGVEIKSTAGMEIKASSDMKLEAPTININ